MTNTQRIRAIQKTLAAYAQIKDGLSEWDPEETVIDLLTDLRHYCDKAHLDVYQCLDISYTHYCAERGRKGGREMTQAAWIAVQITVYCGEHVDDVVKIQERLILPVREEDRAVIQEFLRRVAKESSEFDVKEV